MYENAIYSLTSIIHLLCTIAFLTIAIIAYKTIEYSDFEYMHKLGLNWSRGPITTINKNTFPCEISEDSAVVNFWSGTQLGCYCPNSLIGNNLTQGSCPEESYKGCVPIFPRPPVRYTNWKGIYLCAERVNVTYFDLNIISQDSKCPKDMRSCGTVDSLNNNLCWPTSLECPINDLSVAYNNITKNTELFFSFKKYEGKILSELYISDEQPCADPGYNNFNYPAYYLDVFYGKQNCTGKIGNYHSDYRFVKVDTDIAANVYRDNLIVDSLTALPLLDLKSYNNHPMSLFSRNYIGLNPKCLSELDENSKLIINDLILINNTIESTNDRSYVLLSVGIGMLAVLFTIYGMLCIIYSLDVNFIDIYLFTPFFMFISFVMDIFVFAYSFPVIFKFQIFSGNHIILQRPECVDELTYNAANNFYPSIKNAKNLIIANTCLGGILILNWIVLAYFSYKYKKELDAKEKDQQRTEVAIADINYHTNTQPKETMNNLQVLEIVSNFLN
jgi:hypothetical protein